MEHTYIPAAGHDFFLPFYDPLTRLLGVNSLRRALVEQAGIQAGHRVLDVGTGTGEVALLVARLTPGAAITGLDPDPKGLTRARRKAERAGVEIRFDQGFADALPYPDASFDRLLSSLMLHHLPPEAQAKAVAEMYRVLGSGGRLHLFDFTVPEDGGQARWSRLFHSHQQLDLAGHTESRILGLFRAAGFTQVRTVERRRMLFGRVAFYEGRR